MSVLKIAFVAVAFAFASLGSIAVTSTDAEARCKGCNAPVARRTSSRSRSVRRPVRHVTRHTKSYRTSRVRHVHTHRRTRHIKPIVRVRRIHTVYKRRVVYRQNRTVRRTVRHRARYVRSTTTRVVNLGTKYVKGCGCN